MLMQKAKNKEFWEKVRTDKAYQVLVNQIKEYYESTRFQEIPVLRYDSWKRYFEDGYRSEYEEPYFRRRSYLSALALMTLIYPDNGEYLRKLQNLIWAICEEYTWVVPAHFKHYRKNGVDFIDLFCSETGFALAEIRYLLEDRLDPMILVRIQEEVRKRILCNYENGRFWWETATNNWCAVCAGNVAGALMYLFPEDAKRLMPRLKKTMLGLLDGFADDGTCLEGIAYWHYGFGNYIWFADLLKQFTDGETDLMQQPKVRLVAGYAQRSVLCGNVIVSFADGWRNGTVSILMQNYLANMFPDIVYPLPDEVSAFHKMNVMWMTYFRSLYYLDLFGEPEGIHMQDYDLPSAGQVMINREKYSLAVKAGHNDEPHNHNDIGNFIMSTTNGQVFCDLGMGLYTRQYFEAEHRYGIFCNGSQGHSVPIINGSYQKCGKEYNGTITHKENHITVEIANAYEAGVIDRFSREFIYDESGFLLRDTFSLDYESLTERFVTLEKVAIFDDYIEVAGVIVRFDPQKVQASVHTVQYEDKQGISMVSCVDFAVKPGLKSVEFEFVVINGMDS